MTAYVGTGRPKAMIEEAAAARQARVDKGEDVIVGVNKYRLGTEEHLDTLEVDNHVVREGQIARIKKMKASRDEAACQAALAALTEGAKSSPSLLGEGDRSKSGGGAAGVTGGLATAAPPSVAGATATSPSQVDGEETALLDALNAAEPKAVAAIEAEDFEAAMSALASLRAPIDAFFEGVMVNDPDPQKRAFRLGLLARFRDAVHRVADFSKIEG